MLLLELVVGFVKDSVKTKDYKNWFGTPYDPELPLKGRTILHPSERLPLHQIHVTHASQLSEPVHPSLDKKLLMKPPVPLHLYLRVTSYRFHQPPSFIIRSKSSITLAKILEASTIACISLARSRPSQRFYVTWNKLGWCREQYLIALLYFQSVLYLYHSFTK